MSDYHDDDESIQHRRKHRDNRGLAALLGNRPKMSTAVDALLEQPQFSMNMAGIIDFKKWESGFEGFFRGEGLEFHSHNKQSRQGWHAAKVVARYRERV